MDVGATEPQICTPIEHVTYLYKRLTVSPAGTPGHQQASKRQRHSRVSNTPTCTTDMELEVSPGTPKSYLPCLPNTETSDTAREGATSVGLRGGNVSLHPSHDPQALSSDTAREGATSVGLMGGNVSLHPSHDPQALSLDTAREGATSVGLRGGNVSLSLDTGATSVSTRDTGSRVQVSDYCLSDKERDALQALSKQWFEYNLLKHVVHVKNVALAFNFQQYLQTYCESTNEEKSNFIYVDITNDPADSKETIFDLLLALESKYREIRGAMNYLVVVGDAKTYQHLTQLKRAYGKELAWLLPFPGDWHILKNFQPVLFKAYYDAGLKEIAEQCGFKSSTLTALTQCSNWRITHNFIMQVGESIYRSMLACFLNHRHDFNFSSASAFTSSRIESAIHDLFDIIEKEPDLQSALCAYPSLIGSNFSTLQSEFKEFLSVMSVDDNWSFWTSFVMNDLASYMAVFIGNRARKWDLRMAGIKEMAPLYLVFDRPTYRQVIPDHLTHMLTLPPEISKQFRAGGFSGAITTRKLHCEALDELHEMKINKEAKCMVVRPTEDNMHRISTSLPFRAQMMEKFISQLFPERSKLTIQHGIATKVSTTLSKVEANILAMQQVIDTNRAFEVVQENRGLKNIISHLSATPEQSHDLLTFHKIAQEDFLAYIQTCVVNKSSVTDYQKQHRLNTFSNTRKEKQRTKQLQRTEKMIEQCMRRQASMSLENRDTPIQLQTYSVLPRALVNKDGMPVKGQKSGTTTALSKRYQLLPLVSENLPWIPHSVIIDAMFIIHSTPPLHNKNITDYAHFIMNRYVNTHFERGVMEVHVVFDDPGRHPVTPKSFERQRRDKHVTSGDHTHAELDSRLPTGKRWSSILNCRECKSKLTTKLALAMLEVCPSYLCPGQRFFTAGSLQGELRDSALYCENGRLSPQPDSRLTCNMEEADTRVWLHCKYAVGTKKLIYSPDTDTYHVGMGLLQDSRLTECEIHVQINPLGKANKYINLTGLKSALEADHRLGTIPSHLRMCVLQTLYVCTGCDYISFFYNIGKSGFLKVFFTHADFISSGRANYPGTLADVGTGSESIGFLSFMRLVGSVYFTKNKKWFAKDTPEGYFNSIAKAGHSPLQNHLEWLECIRTKIWGKTICLASELPSGDALQFHWKRSVWVLDMWRQSLQNVVQLLPMEDFGWTIQDGNLDIKWESEANSEKVKEHIRFLLEDVKS